MPGTANKIEDPCQECRERHLKCDDNRPKCKQCERLGQKCRRGKGKIKFRHGSSARYDATFAKDQTWLEQTKNAKFQFVDENPELENYYSPDDIVVSTARPPLQPQNQDDHDHDPAPPIKRHEQFVEDQSNTIHTVSSSEFPISLPPFSNVERVLVHAPIKRRRTADSASHPFRPNPETWSHGAYDPIRSQYRVYDTPKVFSPVSAEGFTSMPEQNYVPKVVEAEYRRLADSAAAKIPEDESLLSPAIWKEEFYWPNRFTTTQCACLMRYYIEVLAPWFDVGDPARHFALAVPQRARRCPPLLNAIFTAASRHLASLPQYKGSDGIIKYQNVPLPKLIPDTALKYHNACIAYLIKLSSDPEHVRDENLLAAAVILRYYEEIDTSFTGEDSETFLHTFQIFVKAQANPYFQILGDEGSPEYLRPGLNGNVRDNAVAYLKSFQHAAFRVALRQETTIAFMKQRAVRLPLERWSILQGFEAADDFVWSDRHLYHCANVLQYCFGGEVMAGRANVERWNELRNYEAQWDIAKPLSFSPIHYQEPDTKKGECLPHIWFMAEIHITGLLHLDLARILLAVYNPNIPRIGQGVSAAHRRLTEEVHDIVVRLCGTAKSASSQPALVQAFMAIAVCGEYFSDLKEQRALLGILAQLEMEYGWPTAKTATDLKEGWGWE